MTEQRTNEQRPYVRADWPRFEAIETIRRVANEQKLYREETILRFAAELLEQADRALVATVRAFRGGSEYVQQGAREEVDKYHAMCGRARLP
jgi:hypothetical protein